jgi:hypothetical protein
LKTITLKRNDMSLDVSLIGNEREEDVTCYSCGHTHKEQVTDTYFDSNITHNLNRMAEAVGIYYHLWRPEEIGIALAGELIEPLTKGLKELKANPENYKGYNASNGWGTYDHFVPWVEEYLNACKRFPDAKIKVSR